MIEFLDFALPFVARNFIRILPLLLITVPLSEWLRHNDFAARYISAFKKRPALAIIVAAGFGALSPLCSCGVIPVIAGFLRAGVPLGPVMAFWIASPSMDPEIYALSAGALGLPLATARLISATTMSLAAGFLAHLLQKNGWIGKESLRGAAAHIPQTANASSFARADCCGSKPESRLTLMRARAVSANAPASKLRLVPLQAATCACGAGNSGSGPSVAEPIAREKTTIAAAFINLMRGCAPEYLRLGGIMLLAFTLEALVIRFVPATLIAPLLGQKSALAIPLAVALGVPLYITNLASLGLIRGLLEQGMSQGAALAFLLGGAATTIPAMSAVWSLTKSRVFFLYLGSICAGAFVSGYIWQAISALAGW